MMNLFIQKWWTVILLIPISLLLLIFLFKGTRYNHNYLITNIEYSAETKAKYGNTELFVLASKFLRGKYYNTLRIGGEKKLLERVKKEYPFVKSANIQFLGNQKIKVDFDFVTPTFLVSMGEKKFGVWHNGISDELEPSRSLGKTGFTVETPQYLSGITTLSGFFYEVGYQRYKTNLPLLQQTFPNMSRFVYLAGSPNFVIFENKKMIFFHKDQLAFQLKKLQQLQTFYPDYTKLTHIDLGSLTQEKVIVWK